VPAVYDFGPDGDDFYIAMEFIEGHSLETLLRQGRLSAADAAGHASWLCGFLERAHTFCSVVDGKSYRVVHTDLKPAHLMISPNGDRRVLDFGIAKALEESRELGTDIARTVAYASPERLVSDQVSPHADFWSLGVMLFEMVCGHRPYPQLDGPRFRRDLERAITANAPRAPLPDSCPPALGAIISKLLAFQVEHRYPTAAAIRADLEMFLRGEVPDALTIYETPATTPVQRVSAVGTAVVEPVARAVAAPAAIADVSPATTPRLGSHAITPTEPRPAGDRPVEAQVVDIVPATVPVGRRTAEVARPSVRRRVMTGAAMLAIFVVVVTEGVAWIFAERFRDTMATIDERNVTERRLAYDAVDRAGLLDIGLHARVDSNLYSSLISVGDRVISDYRREEPAMGPAEWAQAHAALTWAIELSRASRSLRSKQLTAAGHVKRFEAQAAKGGAATLRAQESLALFQQAAEADPESYDPYLGIARIQVYALGDVDAAASSIEEAERRGYVRGRREAALLGDGYLRRASASARRARVLTGEQRERELLGARTDYERCVSLFDPIVAFGNSAKNLEMCKAGADQVERQLQIEPGLGES
jgi:hypothetical protein